MSAAPQRRWTRSASRWHSIDIAAVLTIVGMCIAFAWRPGVPGLRHDWLWPFDAREAAQLFMSSGVSQWSGHGFGAPGQTASLNVALAFVSAGGVLGIDPRAILGSFESIVLVGAYAGLRFLLRTLDCRRNDAANSIVAFAYALGPVCFEKNVAGHIYWLLAYAALPALLGSALRAMRPGSSPRWFAAAALLYSASTTQIQFVLFDAFVLLAVLAVYGRRRANVLWTLGVLAVGALHNADGFATLFETHQASFLSRSHVTLQWERDMSASVAELATLGGYLHYDRAALESMPLATSAFSAACAYVPALALTALAFVRDRRALLFGGIALIALGLAAGLEGPLARPLIALLGKTDLFTLVREFYHVMALYAVGAAVLCALALNALPPRVGTLAALPLLGIALPFLTGGLPRLVPNVTADSAEQRACATGAFVALLPFQEPIAAIGVPTEGLDPGRTHPCDVASDAPLFVSGVLDSRRPLALARRDLQELGVREVRERPDRRSALAANFEPNVGATFAAFAEREAANRERFAMPLQTGAVGGLVVVQDANGWSPSIVADAELPPGRSVSFSSSYHDNNVTRGWVSGRLWSWSDPAFDLVLADPVLSSSGSALPLDVHGDGAGTLYVLAATHGAPTLDGRRAARAFAADRAPYRWFAWPLNGVARPVGFASLGMTAVARAIVSGDAQWHPKHGLSGLDANPSPVSYMKRTPWKIDVSLPASPDARYLVLRQSYDVRWSAVRDGRQLAGPLPFGGIFPTWRIAPHASTQAIELRFEPMSTAIPFLTADGFAQALLVAISIVPTFLRRW